MGKFGVGDRVRKVGSSEIHIIEEVHESSGGETFYWTVLQCEVPTRVFVKETDLEVEPVSDRSFER